jgi:hypothetical protein
MYCQINSFSVGSTRAEKIHKVVQLINKFEVDGVVFCESGINWDVGPLSRDLISCFDPYMEREICATGGHNRHGPKVSPFQQGGMAMLLTNTLLPYAQHQMQDCQKLGAGHLGLSLETQSTALGWWWHIALGTSGKVQNGVSTTDDIYQPTPIKHNTISPVPCRSYKTTYNLEKFR